MLSCTTKSPKQALLATLTKTSESGIILYGHQDDILYGHAWNAERGRSDVKDVCGDYPAILGIEIGGVELQQTESIDRVKFDLIREAVADHHKRGGITTISWHLANPLTDGNSWDISCDTVVRSILPTHSLNEKFNGYLKNLADFLLSLRDENGELIPLIFRPWHEHTGSWFWWGHNFCSAEEYVALWNMTKNYLNNAGLDNLLYAYSPNLGVDKQTYMERYPSDEIIDILGIDIYQFVKKDSVGEIIDLGDELFMAETDKVLAFLTELGAEHHKPIAFTETGLEGLPNPEWWTKTLLPVIGKYPIAYVLTWRNAHDRPEHFYAPFPNSPSAEDFIKFYNSSKTGFLKTLKNGK
jgi:mannan endo-1,4-beta-mannosidase